MNPELVMVQADHDLRNPADFLIIDKIAKAMVHVHGIAQVQTITRPDGKPIEHASLAYTVSQSGNGQLMNNDYQQTVLANTLKQANEMQTSIDSQQKLYDITLQLADVTQKMAAKMANTSDDIKDVRDHLADFDDTFRPMRNYFYWEPHCFDIPLCWSLRSIFDSLDGIGKMSDDFQDIVPDLNRMAELTPQMAAVMPATRAIPQPKIKSSKPSRTDGQMIRVRCSASIWGKTADSGARNAAIPAST
jgi:RND superfamily putative drug exporter